MSAPSLQIFADPGMTVDLYMGIGTNWLLSSDGSLEAFNADNIGDYAMQAIETPSADSTGMYVATPPTLATQGWYWLFWCVRNGDNPAIGDFANRFGQESVYWDGNVWSPVGGVVATIDESELRSAVGLASANLDTQLAAVQQGDAAVTLPTEAPEGYGGTGLDAAEMRTAVGLATANLDTQLAGPLNADLQKIKGLAVTCRRAVTILNRVGKYVAPQGLIAGLRGGKKSKQPKNRRQVKR